MATTQLLIKRLNATNYGNWAFDMKCVLMERNCWWIVEGSETEPDEKEVIERKNYHDRDRQALATINFYIEHHFRKIIKSCDSSTEAWKKIRSHFLLDRAYHMSLTSELFSCKLKESESINLYAARLLSISHKMKEMNMPIDEVYLSFQLLRYLPARFDRIMGIVLRWPDEKFVFEDIVKELVTEEEIYKLFKRNRENSVTSPHATQIYRQNPRRKFFCYECGEEGHTKSQCRYKLEDAKPRYYEGRDTATSATRDISPLRYRDRARGRSTNTRRRPSLKNYRPDCSD